MGGVFYSNTRATLHTFRFAEGIQGHETTPTARRRQGTTVVRPWGHAAQRRRRLEKYHAREGVVFYEQPVKPLGTAAFRVPTILFIRLWLLNKFRFAEFICDSVGLARRRRRIRRY